MIVEFRKKGVRHVAFKDPTHSGCIVLPIEPGESEFSRDRWTWDGNAEKPTLQPSVKGSGDHFNLTAGMIHFCSDARHANAGKVVPLEDMGALAEFWSKDR